VQSKSGTQPTAVTQPAIKTQAEGISQPVVIEAQPEIGLKRGIDSVQTDRFDMQPPAAKLSHTETNHTVFDARKALEREISEALRTDPAGFPDLLKEFKKNIAPVVEKYEARFATTEHSYQRPTYHGQSGGLFTPNTQTPTAAPTKDELKKAEAKRKFMDLKQKP